MEKNLSEIAKLTERISKDPKSKLFVPLAEEYKKTGDIDMAVMVLQEGLANNPGYVTARSFLGRLLLENGDLVGAQKELEEVIKTIPDNLLAQRKLGDLYILMHRNSDALSRYKAALSLNPGDKEVTSLIADLEAGKDVSTRIPKPKPPKPPAEEKKPESLAASVTTPVPKEPAPAVPPRNAPAAAPKAAQGAKKEVPAAPQTVQAAPVLPSKKGPDAPLTEALIPEEADAVEEILEIEPLEPSVVPAGGKKEQRPQGIRDAIDQPSPMRSQREDFDLSEPASQSPPEEGKPEPVQWQPDVRTEQTAERWTPPAEDSSDDINTNTLAELYITQGFYEKAIEIYEGMLAEKPSSQGLKRKLEKIREMAGVAEQNAAFTAPPASPAEDSVRSDLFTEAGGAQAERGPEPADRVLREASPRPAVTGKPQSGPTPPGPGAGAPDLPSEHEAPAGPQGATERRKETIDRLESWLKNVIKEKP